MTIYQRHGTVNAIKMPYNALHPPFKDLDMNT